MKKTIYLTFVLSAVIAMLWSCGVESPVDNTPVTGTPEKDVAGKYVGTWVRILDKDTTTMPDCYFELIADSSYVVDVKVYNASDVGLTEMVSVANIAQESYHGYVFSNMAGDKNGFGSSFRGRAFDTDAVAGTDSVMIAFVKTVKVGRKSYEYQFSYTGKSFQE